MQNLEILDRGSSVSPVLCQVLVDCSGGDEISEESGFERKKDALLQIVGGRPRPRERATSDEDDEWNFGREKSARGRREARRKSGERSVQPFFRGQPVLHEKLA